MQNILFLRRGLLTVGAVLAILCIFFLESISETSQGSAPATVESKLNEEPDYAKYPAGLTGLAGMNLQHIWSYEMRPAMRVRVGHRGLYKGSLVRLPNGDLLVNLIVA